jgi:hypothetical protein
MKGNFLGVCSRLVSEGCPLSNQLIDEMNSIPGRDARLLLAVSTRRVSLPSSDSMTKHSKNNTASSIFSYAERKKLDYGTKGVRTLITLDIFTSTITSCSNALAMSLCGDLMHVLCVYNEHATR